MKNYNDLRLDELHRELKKEHYRFIHSLGNNQGHNILQESDKRIQEILDVIKSRLGAFSSKLCRIKNPGQ